MAETPKSAFGEAIKSVGKLINDGKTVDPVLFDQLAAGVKAFTDTLARGLTLKVEGNDARTKDRRSFNDDKLKGSSKTNPGRLDCRADGFAGLRFGNPPPNVVVAIGYLATASPPRTLLAAVTSATFTGTQRQADGSLKQVTLPPFATRPTPIPVWENSTTIGLSEIELSLCAIRDIFDMDNPSSPIAFTSYDPTDPKDEGIDKGKLTDIRVKAFEPKTTGTTVLNVTFSVGRLILPHCPLPTA